MHKSMAARLGVGIDFGTSNSVAAVFDGVDMRIMEFGPGRSSLPSATYLDRTYLAVTGQEALDAYIRDNVGRRVELAAVPLGHARLSTGSYDEQGLPQTADSHLVFSEARFDVNLPGRLFYGSKQLLADEASSLFPVFERQFRIEAIITPIILRLKDAVRAWLAGGHYGGEPSRRVRAGSRCASPTRCRWSSATWRARSDRPSGEFREGQRPG